MSTSLWAVEGCRDSTRESRLVVASNVNCKKTSKVVGHAAVAVGPAASLPSDIAGVPALVRILAGVLALRSGLTDFPGGVGFWATVLRFGVLLPALIGLAKPRGLGSLGPGARIICRINLKAIPSARGTR